jgi:hypothetical protein
LVVNDTFSIIELVRREWIRQRDQLIDVEADGCYLSHGAVDECFALDKGYIPLTVKFRKSKVRIAV